MHLRHLIFYISIFLLPFFCSAQMERFEHVQWEVIPSPGLSNSFQVRMILHKWNDKIVVIEPDSAYLKWDNFLFHGQGLQQLKYGIGQFNIPTGFNGPDSIEVKAICINPSLNSSFYVPIKYCKSLRMDTSTLVTGEFRNPGYIMTMNTGEEFPANAAWFDWTRLYNQSSSGVEIGPDYVLVNSKVPVKSVRVVLQDKISQRTVLEQELEVTYPPFLQLDFSGRNGYDGRAGKAATAWSMPGGNGENGQDGLSAENLFVIIRPYEGEEKGLLEIIAFSGNHISKSYVAAEGVQIQVIARGGNGGDGGNGGNGADAQQTESNYQRQKGGVGGSGGYGGSGGDGGNVKIYVDSTLHFDENSLKVNCIGGSPGKSGNPGQGGRNDHGNDGLLTRMLVEDKRIPGESGASGYAGRDGMLLGIVYVNRQLLIQELRNRGIE